MSVKNVHRYVILSLVMVSAPSVESCWLSLEHEQLDQSIVRISEETQLTDGPGESFYPAWSPDGRRLAFVSTRSGNWDVWVMERDGSGQRPLTTYEGLDAAPAWSPDGRTIAFASRMLDSGNIAQLMLMESDGSSPKPASLAPNTKQLLSTWSPDGRELAVIVEPMDEPAHWELRVIDIQTTQTRILVRENVNFSSLAWRPDGRVIAFARTPRQKREIWTIAPGGTDLQPIMADQANNSDPDWSPDGRMLVFSSDRSGHSEIWLLDLSTRQLRQLSAHRAIARHPRWSPDGRTVAFTSNRSGRDQSWVMSSQDWHRK